MAFQLRELDQSPRTPEQELLALRAGGVVASAVARIDGAINTMFPVTEAQTPADVAGAVALTATDIARLGIAPADPQAEYPVAA